MKKQMPSSFWRLLAGALIGAILSYVLFLAFAADTFGENSSFLLRTVGTFFVPPILGLFTVFSKIEAIKINAGMGPFNDIFGPFFMVCALLFYPVFLAALFYAAGMKQTRNIIFTEVGIVAVVMVLGIIGSFSAS